MADKKRPSSSVELGGSGDGGGGGGGGGGGLGEDGLLVDLSKSPKFPHRPVSNLEPSSTSGYSTPLYGPHSHKSSTPSDCSGEGPARDTVSTLTSSTSDSSSIDSKSKRKILFKPSDIISFVKRPEDSLSPTPRSDPSKSPRPRGKGMNDSQIQKANKLFTVSPKDVGVLERIGHRAQQRAIRVRKPHEVFVEMEEIRMDPSNELEWAETARWIKFEEDVEEGSGRWGRPHISALAFHSLVELQRGLDKGCVMLDLNGDDFPTIVDEIVDHLMESRVLHKECSSKVRTLLLKKHRHSTEDTTIWEKLKHSATDGNLHHLGEGFRRRSSVDLHGHLTHRVGGEGKVEFKTLENLEDSDEVTTSPFPLVPPSSSPGGSPAPPDGSSPTLVQIETSPASNRKVTFTFTSSPRQTTDSAPLEEMGIEEGDKEAESPVTTPIRKRHTSSVMNKIPDEAESLTVLVGGVKFLEKPITVFVRLGQSHHLGDLTEVPIPVRFIFLQIGPDDGALDYHEVGRAMATLMSDAHFHEIAYSALCKEDLLEGMDEFLDDSLVLPPGDWGEDLLLPAMHERNNARRRKEYLKEAVESYDKMVTKPLKHSRRPLGGIWKDLKNLASRYPSDFKDALTPQVFISIIFIYISFLAPAIAFGGLMEEVTNNFIGETETLCATGLGGIIYGLFAVQPLTVLAFTGPVLVFESIIFRFSNLLDIPYIEWRAVIALWLMCILLFLALNELTFLVHYFTRFSEEVFTGIIAVFFIYEAGLSIVHIFERNPICGLHYPCGKVAKNHLSNSCVPINLSDTTGMSGSGLSSAEMNDSASLPTGFRICGQPNTALWSLILALATFTIALFLRKLRFKKFLGKKTRRLVSDFGMLAAITSMVLVAYLLRGFITVEVLFVPPKYGVSRPSSRGWFINPFNGSLSVAAGFGAIIPALLLAILIFVENQLAILLINKPDHKLTKPVGYHIDLSVVALLSGLSGLIGIPFLCGASVRSIQHLQALSVFTKKHAPGEKPRLVKIHEQRITNIVVHALIALTPFASPVLEVIPISVVLGVFFYLAYASLSGVQLMTRIKLLFILPKHHPDVNYVRKVRTWKMNMYTLIQIGCVLLLYGVKLSPAAMIYPLVIVLMIPLRWLLGKTVYSKDEIEALDNEESKPDNEDYQEFGEFEMTHVPY